MENMCEKWKISDGSNPQDGSDGQSSEGFEPGLPLLCVSVCLSCPSLPCLPCHMLGKVGHLGNICDCCHQVSEDLIKHPGQGCQDGCCSESDVEHCRPRFFSWGKSFQDLRCWPVFGRCAKRANRRCSSLSNIALWANTKFSNLAWGQKQYFIGDWSDVDCSASQTVCSFFGWFLQGSLFWALPASNAKVFF